MLFTRDLRVHDNPALAWRDFFNQVTAAFPAITTRDYRPGRVRWRDDREAFDAWREGRTGVPIVDAGMRQWAAGTGNDTRPGRVLSPLRQATRFDAADDYVRRYVTELAGLDAVAIRRPWTLPESQRRAPIVEI